MARVVETVAVVVDGAEAKVKIRGGASNDRGVGLGVQLARGGTSRCYQRRMQPLPGANGVVNAVAIAG